MCSQLPKAVTQSAQFRDRLGQFGYEPSIINHEKKIAREAKCFYLLQKQSKFCLDQFEGSCFEL